ncbi:MAG: polysaccharide deacetylase family protein [Tannerellaceae bacterium]|jgi:hypothetical protein|nr:polysaccharide deacetylase family protein [Tannerellaceae bacterium]
MNEILSYLIRFLLGDDDVAARHAPSVGYTDDPDHFSRYALVIIPSGFFNPGTYATPASLPCLPLKEIEGLPVLFGQAREEQRGRTWVIHADLIAGAYFLITRYEEMMRPQVRDVHGRFPGKESLPFRAGFLHRPLIDHYRLFLRKRLGLPQLPAEIRQIFLTHDVDAPFLYRSWKGFLRSILDQRGLVRSLKGKTGHPVQDPYYTFPQMLQQDRRLMDKHMARSVFFFKAGGRLPEDKPHYNLRNKDILRLMAEIRRQGGEIGLHASYEAGIHPALLAGEKRRLEQCLGHTVSFNRHHFLACREPDDMDCLEKQAFSEDFTLGYADRAGFRLGTSYPVSWINPRTRRLTSLCLHPLTVMDCSLEEEKYMGLSRREAFAFCLRLAHEVKRVGGELSLLWHNTSLREGSGSYLGDLYPYLLTHLLEK